MSNKIQSLILGAIVVLAVAVIGLYLRGGDNIITNTFSDNPSLSGTSDVSELCLGDLDIENTTSQFPDRGQKLCKGSAEFTYYGAQATGTVAWQNRTGSTIYIPAPSLMAIYSNTASTTHVLEVGTSTSNGLNTANQYTGFTNSLMSLSVATGTKPAFVATTTNIGGVVNQNVLTVASNEWIVGRVRAPQCPNAIEDNDDNYCGFATTTQKSFNIDYRFDYWY